MVAKVLVLLGVFCSTSSSLENNQTTVSSIQYEQPIESLNGKSGLEVKEEVQATPRHNWDLSKFWQWGRKLINERLQSSDFMETPMRHLQNRDEGIYRNRRKLKNKIKFLINIHQTLTRRDSSVVVPKGFNKDDFEALSTTRGHSTARLVCDSGISLGSRPRGCFRKEIITTLFESMLDNIVESWEVIEQHKYEDANIDIDYTPSEITSASKKKKTTLGVLTKSSKTKKIQSKLELNDSNTQSDLMQMCWWAGQDEKAIIRFRNGNVYEGRISMKCMHGEGRYQWADGTVFLGQFIENEINGKGIIHWKDDTWYEGDFAGNLRHGRGLYVNSREQSSYSGVWDCGTKHGDGVIYFPESCKNSYEGQWVNNVRHGFGSREYCKLSGYKGEWKLNVREGKGLMIWPNHDFYTGEWLNGVMSGYGYYIWGAFYNSSMSSPSQCAYRGLWENGKRSGHGLLNLGLGLGSYYKGEFKNDQKHGVGEFVTNNGLILRHEHLFLDNNIGVMSRGEQNIDTSANKCTPVPEPLIFDICDSSVGLIYHIEKVVQNIDKRQEIIIETVKEFMEVNKIHTSNVTKNVTEAKFSVTNFRDLIDFEVSSLSKALKCYETNLKNMYYLYATICNKEEIHFTPILIRLYLWQLYYDCNVHEKGLTLVQIDRAFHENPQWLSRSPHNPFEKIYFWQFQHSLVTVASKLYAKRQLPGSRPDTMLASAFRYFMDNDILPGVGRKKGKLAEGYGAFIPLNALYTLYRSLGEPCSIRNFLCAVRYSPHEIHKAKLTLVDHEYHNRGRNAYIFGDEMFFMKEQSKNNHKNDNNEKTIGTVPLELFNFGNLSNIFKKLTYIMRTKNPMAKKPHQILFSKNTYHPKVKVENWDYQIHAEKRDNYVYRDQLSNHLSTYLRWGDQDQNFPITETRDMLEQVFTKTDPVYTFKPLVNFTSYPCTDTPGRNKLMKNAKLAEFPADFGVIDYQSTQQDDYRNPHATVAKPLMVASPSWLLNRVIRSDLTHNHGTAPPQGSYQCLDTHTPIGHIREMRLFRYQSFNPATCLQDFPDVDLKPPNK